MSMINLVRKKRNPSPSKERAQWPNHHQSHPKILPLILNHKFWGKKKFNPRDILLGLRRISFLILLILGTPWTIIFKRDLQRNVLQSRLRKDLLKNLPNQHFFMPWFIMLHIGKIWISDELSKGTSSEPIEWGEKYPKAKPILPLFILTSITSFEPISKLIRDPNDPKYALPSKSYDDPVIDFRDSIRNPRQGSY